MSLPALYTLADEYRQLRDALADLDLPPESVADTLEGAAGDLEVKATNTAMVVQEMEALAEAIGVAAQQMLERRKAIQRRAEAVREYLRMNMQRAEISKISSPWFALTIKKNPPKLEIEPNAAIPDEFMRMPPMPQPEPDKKALLAACKEGKEFLGVRLIQDTRLEIK